jgi:hypothetical protein
VFGCLVGGEDVLDTLEKIPVKPGTDRPAQPVKITDIMMFAAVTHIVRASSDHIIVTRIPSKNTRRDKKSAEHGKLKRRKKPGMV